MTNNEVGNSLDDALEIIVGEIPFTYSDWVGETDPDDYYRFTLDNPSDFSLSLTELDDDADVELLDGNGAVLFRSENWHNEDEHINLQLLEGTYYIRVYPHSSYDNANYNLTVTATPVLDAGNTFTNAREITVGEIPSTYSDWVGVTDPYDYYRFTLDNASDFSLSLTELDDDADVELLDSSGAVLFRSENWLNEDENINLQLLEGTYYIRVYPHNSHDNANYNLTVTATPVPNYEHPPSTPNTLYIEELRRDLSRGIIFNGPEPYDKLGRSLTVADFNQDGYRDVFLGASAIRTVEPEGGLIFIINGVEVKFELNAGYLLYGKPGGFQAPIDLASLDGTEGSVFQGKIEGLFFTDEAGFASTKADINGDGIDDLIIGAPEANTHVSYDAGKVHFLYGTEQGFANNLKLDELDGKIGFTVTGNEDYDNLGFAVENARDFNGDGFDDVMMSAPGADQVFILTGGQNYPAKFNVNDLNTNNGFPNGFRIDGNEGDLTGYALASPGDVDQDGYDDVIVQSRSARETHLVFGRPDSSNRVINLNQPEPGSSITFLNEELVTEIATGDFDNDGRQEMVLTGRWATYVIDIKLNGLPSIIDLENFPAEYVQKFDKIGGSVKTGDINGDGYTDLAIGEPHADVDGKNSVGRVLILFGSPEGLPKDIDNLVGNQGFYMLGENSFDRFGSKLALEDLDGDGFDDIFVSAENGPNGTSSGQVAIFYGQPNPIVDLNGSDIGIDDTVDFTGSSPVIVDGDLIVTSPDPIKYNTLSGARVTITNLWEVGSEILTADTSGTNIESVYNSTTGILTLDGTDTIANYQNVLRSITYNNTAPSPDSSDRIITYVVDDSPYGSAIAKTTLVMKTPNILGGTVSEDMLNGTSGNDNIHARAGDDVLNGGDGDDTLTGGAGNDTLNGEAGNDLLRGEEGDDVLNGGDGDDTLIGSLGNDTYIVDSNADSLIEVANAGTDTVESSITFTLGNHLENLTLTGTANIDGTGNELDNVITGNSGQNYLSGGEGNDTIDGGTGNDTLAGGKGDDIYFVDSSNDSVEEEVNSGTDTVFASQSFKLESYYIENLTLVGTADINGTGSGGDNLIIGNSGNNHLDGGDNNDTLIGGDGDDTYYLDDKDDIIIEEADAGIDSVVIDFYYSSDESDEFILGEHLENLILEGEHEIGTGNALANHITGNDEHNLLKGEAGDDTLSGDWGNDTLIGGVGADTFVFSSRYEVSYSYIFDTITDFSAADGDIIQIDAVAYGISDISEVRYDAIAQSIIIDENKVATLEGVTSFDVSQSVVLV
ncbi:MAG: hypothetical protein QNJ18_04480 [Xenococcaceae cyanobacterium MO_167.B52]|nr:hypothetical protein [Xenococcaceae cyanobacterium MO_167.B52]